VRGGYNLRWLLQMIAKKGLPAILWLLPAHVRRSVERALAVPSAQNRSLNDAMLARVSPT
jgi:hypothetical protein